MGTVEVQSSDLLGQVGVCSECILLELLLDEDVDLSDDFPQALVASRLGHRQPLSDLLPHVVYGDVLGMCHRRGSALFWLTFLLQAVLR